MGKRKVSPLKIENTVVVKRAKSACAMRILTGTYACLLTSIASAQNESLLETSFESFKNARQERIDLFVSVISTLAKYAKASSKEGTLQYLVNNEKACQGKQGFFPALLDLYPLHLGFEQMTINLLLLSFPTDDAKNRAREFVEIFMGLHDIAQVEAMPDKFSAYEAKRRNLSFNAPNKFATSLLRLGEYVEQAVNDYHVVRKELLTKGVPAVASTKHIAARLVDPKAGDEEEEVDVVTVDDGPSSVLMALCNQYDFTSLSVNVFDASTSMAAQKKSTTARVVPGFGIPI
ncbi:MAG: hypothetical protein DHS20C10_01940 [marine bacterium B5-7]|nr:MAG: hypothetical protein DHS20C10_01940 [marine bacterium B5-7]